MSYKRSVFPEGGYDTFVELYDLPPSYEPLVLEFAELRANQNRTPEEEIRFNELTVVLQNYILDPEKWNKFCDAVTGLQKFFLENTQGYIDDLKAETRQTVDDGKAEINTTKDNALIAIENKKENIIDYMDGTTAGQIRNDIGVMADSTIEGRSLVDKTNNLKEQVDTNTQNISENSNKITLLSNDLETHKGDYVYQEASGTATSIILTINETLKNGYPMTFVATANNNGATTTINGKRLYKPNTTVAPNLIKGKAYTVWYDSINDCFFVKASAEGNASVSDVLAGKTFSNDDDTGIMGIMPNNGSINKTLTTQGGQIAIPKGYTEGGVVKAYFNNLTSHVIKKGTNVGGIVGNLITPRKMTYRYITILGDATYTVNMSEDRCIMIVGDTYTTSEINVYCIRDLGWYKPTSNSWWDVISATSTSITIINQRPDSRELGFKIIEF